MRTGELSGVALHCHCGALLLWADCSEHSGWECYQTVCEGCAAVVRDCEERL